MAKNFGNKAWFAVAVESPQATLTSHTNAANFLIENLEVKIIFFNERAVGVELPKSVVLRVTQTDPGHKGNTVTNTYKAATLETGHVVQVPLHIAEGDTTVDLNKFFRFIADLHQFT